MCFRKGMRHKKGGCVMDNNVSIGLGLAHEVEVMFRKVGATRENFWKPISKNKELAQRVFDSVVYKTTLEIIGDYDQSFQNMIKAGNYDEIDNDITETIFPAELEKKNKKKYPIALFHFSRKIISDDAFTEIKRRHYRPIFIEELFVIGEQHPNLQRELTVVGLGSLDYHFGHPYLTGNDSFRRLGTHWQDLHLWNDNCCFAAVHE